LTHYANARTVVLCKSVAQLTNVNVANAMAKQKSVAASPTVAQSQHNPFGIAEHTEDRAAVSPGPPAPSGPGPKENAGPSMMDRFVFEEEDFNLRVLDESAPPFAGTMRPS
jgi:hypothetical protein